VYSKRGIAMITGPDRIADDGSVGEADRAH